MGRIWLFWGCIFALVSVALGAFAAHALKGHLQDSQMALMDTAHLYLTTHSLALLALGLWNHWEKWSNTLFAGLCFMAGILFFSGSLYAYALTEISWLVRLTPVGGVLFLFGWALFALSVLRAKNEII